MDTLLITLALLLAEALITLRNRQTARDYLTQPRRRTVIYMRGATRTL